MNSLYLKLAKVKSSKKLRKFIQILRNIFGEENPGTINFDFEKKPSRLFIIQEIINKKKFRSYLEIGTFKNEVFSNIVCEKKIDDYWGLIDCLCACLVASGRFWSELYGCVYVCVCVCVCVCVL